MIKYILAGLLLGAAHGMTVPVRSEPTRDTSLWMLWVVCYY